MPKSNDPMAFFEEAEDIADGREPIGKIEETNEEKETRLAAEKKALEDKNKKGNKAPDESTRELRNQRDTFKKEAEELKKKLAELEPLKANDKLKPLSKVAEYLEKKYGKLDDEVVTQYIEKNKKRKGEVAELGTKYKEKDEQVKQFGIIYSQEFQDGYEKPLIESRQSLVATIANVDPETMEVKNPELIAQLEKALLGTNKDGTILTPVQQKAIIQRFMQEYEKKTGEPYDPPLLASLNDSIKAVHNRFQKRVAAVKDWETEQQEKKKTRDYEDGISRTERQKKEMEGREFLFEQALKDFPLDSIEGILSEDDIKELATAKHDEYSKMYKGELKTKLTYKDIITDSTKAKAYDKIVERYRELENELELEKKKNSSGLGARSRDPKPKNESEEARKVREKREQDDKKSPVGFLDEAEAIVNGR